MPDGRALAASIVIVALCAMILVSPYELALSQRAATLEWPMFNAFMERSVFEGEGLGGSDLPILLQIISLFLFAYSFRSGVRWIRWASGYFVLCGLGTALVVHLMKGIIGRARPNQVFPKDPDAYTAWYEPGARVLDGWLIGSFPSGHTATMMTMLGLSYIWLGLRKNPATAYVIAMLALALAFLMGLSRQMTLDHWATDTLGSVMVGAGVAYGLAHLLQLPRRMNTD